MVKATLTSAMLLGETLIVTNGNRTWVEDSAGKYMPGLLPLLAKLTVVSARSLMEAKHPKDPFMWKRATFEHLLADVRGYPEKGNLNLVVLGDQYPEIDAAHHMAGLMGDAVLVKTVKFQEGPSVSDLIGQLSKVESELAEIVSGEEDWSRSLVRREPPAGKPAGKLKFGRLEARQASAWRFSAKGTGHDACAELFVGVRGIWRLFF